MAEDFILNAKGCAISEYALFSFVSKRLENCTAYWGATCDKGACVTVTGGAVADTEGSFREFCMPFADGDVDWRTFWEVFTEFVAMFA